MEPRVASINHTRATECLLPERLMSMPHLLLLEDSEDLHFMVVMVLWVEAWETTVVQDQLSRPRLPKDSEEAVHSVAPMTPLLVEAHIHPKTNRTTTPIKGISLARVMI